MQKRTIFVSLLIVLTLILGLTQSVLATTPIQPRTGDYQTDASPNEQLYGIGLPENEDQGTTINNQLEEVGAEQQKDNRGAVVTIVVVITIGLIAILIVWYYKTNY